MSWCITQTSGKASDNKDCLIWWSTSTIPTDLAKIATVDTTNKKWNIAQY